MPLMLQAEHYRGLPLPKNLIALDDPQGQGMLFRSHYKNDYWPLTRWYTTQEAPAWCGIAASVIVLNALGVTPREPVDPHAPDILTQQNFFSSPVRHIATPQQVSQRGMTLDRLANALGTYPVSVKATHARPGGLPAFVREARQVLQSPGNFLVVNYLRSAIGQQTSGHFSPVAAYDETRDRFLILDVARYKYPPVWVRSEELFQAMQTFDDDAKANRGYLIVSARPASEQKP